MRIAIIAAALVGGILAANYLSPVVTLISSAIVVLVALAKVEQEVRPVVLIIAAIFAFGWFRYTGAMQIAPDDISRFVYKTKAFEGTVAADPDIRKTSTRVLVRADKLLLADGWRRASGFVMMNLYPADVSVGYGDRVRITAWPYLPKDPTNPGQMSWREYLNRQGIYACVSVRESSNIRVIDNEGNPAVRAILWVKNYLTGSIERIHPPREAALINGIVLGSYSYLDQQTLSNFTRSGTLHILAASGFNCFLLALIVEFILGRMQISPKMRSVVTILLLAAYVVMVGTKPSIVRAAIMTSIYLLGPMLGRVPNIRSTFFTAGIISLIIWPSDIFDVGFQLSFLAVWSLITVAPAIESSFQAIKGTSRKKHNPGLIMRCWRWAIGTLAGCAIATTAIMIITAPVTAYYFNYLSLILIPANISIALVAPVIFAEGLASGVIALLGPLGPILGLVGTYSTKFMLAAISFFAPWTWSAIYVRQPSLGWITGYYMIIYSVLTYWRSRDVR